MKPLAFLAALALAAGAADAASWNVDPAASRLGFEVQVNGQPVQGTFQSWSAAISFDPAAPEAGHARVAIDLTKVETGNASRDKALPGPEWFDAAGTSFTAPTGSPGEAVFETTAFRAKGGNAFEADGTLTLRGVSQTLTLPFTLDIAGGKAHMIARLPIDRTKWGVGQGDYASGGTVATNVDVVIDLTASEGP